MLYDKEVMAADNDPFDQAGVIDLGVLGNSGKGKGNVILINVRGKDMAVDGNENYKIVVTGNNLSATDPFFREMEVQMGPITAMSGGITFGLSSAVTRFVKFELSGFTAGTWTCGVVLGVYP